MPVIGGLFVAPTTGGDGVRRAGVGWR